MPTMDSVTLENFRCFREKQTVRLAPLTLLVGENSTGKTSFLALIRALSEFAFEGRPPNFKAPPYDLGSFDEIAHHRGGRGSRADSFMAGMSTKVRDPFSDRTTSPDEIEPVELEVTFGRATAGAAPTPVRQRLTASEVRLDEWVASSSASYGVKVGTARGAWELCVPVDSDLPTELGAYSVFILLHMYPERFSIAGAALPKLLAVGDSPEFGKEDEDALRSLREIGAVERRFLPSEYSQNEPFAGAPVRSQPHRTYDPGRWERDPEGDHVPMRIAELSAQQTRRWKGLKSQLEDFGRAAGLFDEIAVRHLGAAGSDPFQIQVRRWSKRLKGPFRNLIDVGYGVSQVLPVVTELMASSAPTDLYLLQQPEVHLHPSAQAALGTLMCSVAADGAQLVVETHSDHLIDRIRMDVRDGRTKLTQSDVRILYFERDGLDVKIHELWWDDNGNIENTPRSYRRFFMQEVERSVWPPE